MTQPNELIETIEKALNEADLQQPIREESGYYVVFNNSGLITARLYRTEAINLLTNIDEWFRALLEENKRLTEELSHVSTSLSLSRVDVKRLRDELEQAYTELSAKNKVLEWYWNVIENGDWRNEIWSDSGRRARDVLNLYPPRREET